MALLTGLVWSDMARAQELPASPPQPPSAAVPFQEEATKNAAVPCVQPPPLRLEDYDGPLKKIVGTFARKLEGKSVHPPHYKPGAMLCSLKPKDKFILFVQDTLDPVTFLAAGFNAGIDQAENQVLVQTSKGDREAGILRKSKWLRGGLGGETSFAILSYSTEMRSFSRIVACALVATSTRARSTPACSLHGMCSIT